MMMMMFVFLLLSLVLSDDINHLRGRILRDEKQQEKQQEKELRDSLKHLVAHDSQLKELVFLGWLKCLQVLLNYWELVRVHLLRWLGPI